MAEGLARQLAGEGLEVASAGVAPTSVHPVAIEVMAEKGIDIGGQRSQSLEDFLEMSFDDVITVCDRAAQNCPVFPGPATRHHWPLPDPAAVKAGAGEYARLHVAPGQDRDARLVQPAYVVAPFGSPAR